ncbi:MAG TPA: NAD(P)H-binding protein, partial [Ilumatobacter sp.]
MTTSPILVLGASGKTGRRVLARLAAAGHAVRAGSRSADPPFDWEQPATWAPAVAGVHSIYLTYQPDLAFPGAVDRIAGVVAAAAAAGVQRIVLLSGRNEPGARAAELIVEESGLEWTVLTATFFA